MRSRSVIISLALSASLAACNLYFGGVDHDHTPPPEYPDAGPSTVDGNPSFPPDGGSGSGCHTPDADPGGPVPDAYVPPPPPDGGCC